MAIYEMTENGLRPIQKTSLANAGFKERDHLQKHLKDQIDIIAPDTLVISEEFGSWEDSRRRIDLLGVDKNANLVVIELKRTEDGGHMELQAIRYAAMVAGMTFNGAVDAFNHYLAASGRDDDARELLLEFLDWEEPDEDQFAQDVNIVLASAEFSKEVTTAVLWLNEHGLSIRCIRLRPYSDGNKILLDIQQVIPLPEAEEYQVRIRDKARLERVSRTQSRDLTKYDVVIDGKTFGRLAKRQTIYHVIRHLCDSGVDPDEVRSVIAWKGDLMRRFEGDLDSITFEKQLAEQLVSEGKKPLTRRYFIDDDQLIHANAKTYAVTKMWGIRTLEAIKLLLGRYPNHGIEVRESGA